MEKLREILKSSSLTASMSDMEIDEIVEEIKPDLEDFFETEKKKIKDDIYDEYEIDEMRKQINDLKKEVSNLKKTSLPSFSLADIMTAEWVKNNWEWVQKIENLNKSGKEILSMINYTETLQQMSEDFDQKISEKIDKEILKEYFNLGVSKKNLSMDDVQLASDTLSEKLKKVTSHSRIILVGKAASGKDHARKLFEKKGFKYAVSYTTRPPRTGEVNGKDYYFLTEEEFKSMIENGEFYEYVTFNNWYYGTSLKQFYEDNIFIMTPYGVSKIEPNDRERSIVIYFDIDESIRRERLALRSDEDSVDRRIAADEADFQNFTDFDIRITNSNF